MIKCLKCRNDTQKTAWGDWCDVCGGVVLQKGQDTELFFRHVATVEGKGGRFPIVYDRSASAYGVAWPKEVIYVDCVHCGMKTPANDDRRGLMKLDDIKSNGPGFYSQRGSLDAVLACIQPIAQGGGDLPEISAAPTATDDEKKMVVE